MDPTVEACSHCGKEKPARVETCPHCQKRTLKKEVYRKPIIPEEKKAGDSDLEVTLGIILFVAVIAAIATLISRC